MDPDEIRGPDLAGVIADANAAGLTHVVIGGFAVIANGYICATKDSDLLVPDGPATNDAIWHFLERIEAIPFGGDGRYSAPEIAREEHLRVDSRHGVIDLLRGKHPPLDYDTVARFAIEGVWRDIPFRVASLRTLVAAKRLADSPRDRLDLEKLEVANGELPIDLIPDLDDL
jgi:hypothetical protein